MSRVCYLVKLILEGLHTVMVTHSYQLPGDATIIETGLKQSFAFRENYLQMIVSISNLPVPFQSKNRQHHHAHSFLSSPPHQSMLKKIRPSSQLPTPSA